MCDNYREPNILFFKNIDPDEYHIEKIFHQRLIESIPRDDDEYKYESATCNTIPTFFTDYKDWPKKTNIKCWSCHRQFSFVPITVATGYKTDGNKRTYSRKGVFSSFPCAKAYIEKNYSGETREDMYRLLDELYFIFNGVYPSYIPIMIEPQNMVFYGGTMTPDQYDKEEAKMIKMCSLDMCDDM